MKGKPKLFNNKYRELDDDDEIDIIYKGKLLGTALRDKGIIKKAQEYIWTIEAYGFVAARKIKGGKNNIRLSKLIYKTESKKPMRIVYKNGNKLDNRIENLGNINDTGLPLGISKNVSKTKGVRYLAHIMNSITFETISCGTHDTIEQAIKARNSKLKELDGEVITKGN